MGMGMEMGMVMVLGMGMVIGRHLYLCWGHVFECIWRHMECTGVISLISSTPHVLVSRIGEPILVDESHRSRFARLGSRMVMGRRFIER